MIQQPRDLRPPEDSVRVSRRELFRQAYEIFQDESTPEDLTDYVFSAELTGQNGLKVTLTEGAGISRPEAWTVIVSLNTVQMGELTPGQYRMYLYGARGQEREGFVTINILIDP